MKRISIALLFLFSGCSLWQPLQKNCKTDFKTVDGAAVFCAVCDSTTGQQLINAIKSLKK